MQAMLLILLAKECDPNQMFGLKIHPLLLFHY
jgi:hypothetical protein